MVASTLTASDGAGNNGFYRFGDLLPGTYYVRFTAPAGYAISPPSEGSNAETRLGPRSNHW